MQGKIGLEEHFAIDETVDDPKNLFPEETWSELRGRLVNFDMRLKEMDQNGMEMMILSLNAPAVQRLLDPKAANDMARKANDQLAEEVRKRPDRYQAMAALPLQDPDLAIRELERCTKDLGMRGALANGYSVAPDGETLLCYDLPQYWPFWETVERLGFPFYLHPRSPIPSQSKIYEGHSWLLGPSWAFAQESAVHCLRLMGSGLFDKYPKLQIIIGHMGEGLSFNLWRVDYCNAWTLKYLRLRHKYPAKKRIADYFADNFHITVSGNFHTPSLINSMMEIGADRIMFATDWPFENIDQAANWLDHAEISEADRLKIGRTNAIKLFKLNLK
jgi:predicted TIM-barrel fold metal-dependent hydrolase